MSERSTVLVVDAGGHALEPVAQRLRLLGIPALRAKTGGEARAALADPRAAIGAVLADAKLATPAEQRPILGGRRGHHSEHLGHLLAVMQYLPRTYPEAAW